MGLGNTAFKVVSVVFFVFLKLVRPGDAIENVIIEQSPMLEGRCVTQEQLESIFEKFGHRCLFILDGLDEHALGQNDDVLKIIKGQKLLNCHVLVTSRPHSTRKIEQYCETIVRVDGFTKSKARDFIWKLLENDVKVHQVLDFNPTDFP